MTTRTATGFESRERFLALERDSPTKHEWIGGHVYEREPCSKRHGAIVTRLLGLLVASADKLACLLGANDLMVQTEHANYYPDVVVSCDPSDDPFIEHRPCFIAEVLSPTTSRTDRHEKREEFTSLVTMQTYWIVDPDAGVIEVWQRTPDGWRGSHHRGDDEISVQCLGLTVRVDQITTP